MKVALDSDERYPDYNLKPAAAANHWDRVVEIDEALYNRWRAARTEYDAVCAILLEMFYY